MNVLVTGGCGNIGAAAVEALIAAGHRVVVLDLPTRGNRRVARPWRRSPVVRIQWGDIRDGDVVASACAGTEVVVHLAGILPPHVEPDPDTAYQVNVGGTQALLTAAAALPQPPKVLLASTFDLFGHTQDQPPPRRADDPIAITDHYTAHKARCEELVRDSGLTWAIFRFGDVPPPKPHSPNPIMYEIPLANRIELLHRDDAGLAIARAVGADVWGRVWLIGGGESCQVVYERYLRAALGKSGIGMLPEAAFTTSPYCTDWLDTAESQRLLGYQRHTFEQIMADLPVPALAPGWAVRLAEPLVRRMLLRLSPYWTNAKSPTPAGK